MWCIYPWFPKVDNWILSCFNILFFIHDLMSLLLSSCRNSFFHYTNLTCNSNLTFLTQASYQLLIPGPTPPTPPVTECQLYESNFLSSLEDFYGLQREDKSCCRLQFFPISLPPDYVPSTTIYSQILWLLCLKLVNTEMFQGKILWYERCFFNICRLGYYQILVLITVLQAKSAFSTEYQSFLPFFFFT